jgi:hypothetical protein
MSKNQKTSSENPVWAYSLFRSVFPKLYFWRRYPLGHPLIKDVSNVTHIKYLKTENIYRRIHPKNKNKFQLSGGRKVIDFSITNLYFISI